MLIKIIGPEVIRRDHVQKCIYYYGLIGYKTHAYHDPDNKSCIVAVNNDGTVYDPTDSFHTINMPFLSQPAGDNIQVVNLKPEFMQDIVTRVHENFEDFKNSAIPPPPKRSIMRRPLLPAFGAGI